MQQSEAVKELVDIRKKVLDSLGDEALNVEGTLAEKYHDTKAGKEYLAAQAKSAGSRSFESLETSIYNHLYAFFSRYYQDGDFISKRRYSKHERYSIPYNGEEVYLYWANRDQYYIKTGEYFTDYAWKSPSGVTIHFKLKAADVEQNNIKGEKRFFLPRFDEIAWNESERILTILFEYRPLTGQENIAYGQKEQQEAIIAEAIEKIPKKFSPQSAGEALAALTIEKPQNDKDISESYFEYHLKQYTRRNTSDFFIHKNLKGFLSRELDFYLKNEVLNLEEMEYAGENTADGWFQLMRIIKSIGNRIIEFLHQIEEFQKMLWEKRKFVTEVGYCITIKNIPEIFYPEIAACEAQWNEWKALFSIDEEHANLFTDDKNKIDKRIDFLKSCPTLVLDTHHFNRTYVDRLLANYDDLDEITDGFLINSENYQAMNLLLEKYRERVKCIYIDPPYNIGSDEFIYKDSYQHSCWLSMISNRLRLAKILMNRVGSIGLSIDDNEVHRLDMLIDDAFAKNKIGELIVIRAEGGGLAKQIVKGHDYLLLYAFDINHFPLLMRPKDIRGKMIEQQGKRYWIETDWLRIEFGKYGTLLYEDIESIKGSEKKKEIDKGIEQGIYVLIAAGKGHIVGRLRLIEEDGSKFYSVIKFLNANGIHELEALFGMLPSSYPKPIDLLKHYILGSTFGAKFNNNIVLDYFAGSGTTGHAMINLNREDGGQRKFILIEMADYFHTVLMPRIKKVTFTPEWKEGKPKRMAMKEEAESSPRIIKYIRLESYEDALNNIAFEEESGQQALQFEDYLLQYMLKWESRHSETLLNIEKLVRPYDYKLHIYRDGETRVQNVDIPETFNYLLGLDIQNRRIADDKGRQYLIYRGTTRESRKIAIIWRETEGWQQGDYERDRDFVASQKFTENADEVFVNGDSLIAGARALEPIFKARMFAPVEA